MKISILKHMRPNTLYFREELEIYTKRIDFELAHLLESHEIKKHHQGTYSKENSKISDEDLIDKIMSRDRESEYLIIPASKLLNISKELSINDYICLNHKRSDLISTLNFKIKFQIPTHGFPKKLNENFIAIHRLNTSGDLEKSLNEMNLDALKLDTAFIKDLNKYANKRTYKFISDRITYQTRLNELSANLGNIGAPIIIGSSPRTTLKITKEAIIADALVIGMKEPRIHNILPFTILKNAPDIDFKRLQALTKSNGSYRYAGFILELLRKAGYDNIPEFKAPKYIKIPTIPFKENYGKRGIERLKANHLDFALEKWGILIDAQIYSEREKIRKWL